MYHGLKNSKFIYISSEPTCRETTGGYHAQKALKLKATFFYQQLIPSLI